MVLKLFKDLKESQIKNHSVDKKIAKCLNKKIGCKKTEKKKAK